MTDSSPSTPSQLPGLASLGVTVLGWLWFVMCFTAGAQAWWNSLYLFIALYLVAAILAMSCIRSVLGIVALLLALPSLGLVCLFAFHR